ncbi:YSIRK-type signal peptide-containing protein [Lactobacillus crispatus]|uniref:YSIRK-type signal peptide-containing protein n=1 Tax=Lactobacillus crispatus TaxID=47770 RepID=UPI000C7BFD1C|nr:YSIRK-type signal peptide-containing protein [Lactobacillus crispatus]PKZ84675.1 hypothetical protein CYJ83_07755 [Lactobacillus crispatus]
MISKNNKKLLDEKTRDEKQRFSIRKLSIGAASVLIGLTFMAYGGQSVSAATESGSGAAEVTSQNEAAKGSDTQDIEKSGDKGIKTPSKEAGSQNSDTATQGKGNIKVENTVTDPAKAEQELETKENGKVPAVESKSEKERSSSNKNGVVTTPASAEEQKNNTTEPSENQTDNTKNSEASMVTLNVNNLNAWC